jgi:hypothetical protein
MLSFPEVWWRLGFFVFFFYYPHRMDLRVFSLLPVCLFPCSRSFFILDTTMGLCIEYTSFLKKSKN